jgi:hypothetical protein
MRRRKALRKDYGEQSGGGVIFCCKRNNRGRDGTKNEEMDDFVDYDKNVP